MLLGITGSIAIGALISDMVPVLRGIRPASTIPGEFVILLFQLLLYVPLMFLPLSIVIGSIGGGLHGLYLRRRLRRDSFPSITEVERTMRTGLMFAWSIVALIGVAYVVLLWNVYASTPRWIYSVGLVTVFTLAFVVTERLFMRWFRRATAQAVSAEG